MKKHPRPGRPLLGARWCSALSAAAAGAAICPGARDALAADAGRALGAAAGAGRARPAGAPRRRRRARFARTPDVVMTLRAGVAVSPSYFGSKDYEVGPDLAARLDFVRFPGGFEYGSSRSVGFRQGCGPAGLVPLHRRARLRRARRDRGPRRRRLVRRGRPRRRLRAAQLARLHRRALRLHRPQRLGRRDRRRRHRLSDRRPDADRRPAALLRRRQVRQHLLRRVATRSRRRPGSTEFDAKGGLLGAGIEVGARYLFNERWGVEGAANWHRLLNDAADSPVTEHRLGRPVQRPHRHHPPHQPRLLTRRGGSAGLGGLKPPLGRPRRTRRPRSPDRQLRGPLAASHFSPLLRGPCDCPIGFLPI